MNLLKGQVYVFFYCRFLLGVFYPITGTVVMKDANTWSQCMAQVGYCNQLVDALKFQA